MNNHYMQFGCGWCAPPGWLNFDSSPTLRFERLPVIGRLYTRNARRFPDNVRCGDIVRGLPVEEASCRGIYCSHILEHLALEDFRTALRRTFGYLQPGGVFRLVVPDLEALARAYVNSPDADAAHRFMESSFLGRKTRPRSPAGFVRQWLGNSEHLWMWDEKAMRKELTDAGFTDIRRAVFGDAEDSRFNEVEQQERFADALAMQCRRPQ